MINDNDDRHDADADDDYNDGHDDDDERRE